MKVLVQILNGSFDTGVLEPLLLLQQPLFPAHLLLSGKVLGEGRLRTVTKLSPTQAIAWVGAEPFNMVEWTASFEPHVVPGNATVCEISMLLKLSPLNQLWSQTDRWSRGRELGKFRMNMAQWEMSLKQRPIPDFPSIYDFVISFEGESSALLKAIGAALLRTFEHCDACFYATADVGGEEIFIGMNIYNAMIAKLSLHEVIQRYPGAIRDLGKKLDAIHSLVVADARTCQALLGRVPLAKCVETDCVTESGAIIFPDREIERKIDLSEFLIRKDHSTQWLRMVI